MTRYCRFVTAFFLACSVLVALGALLTAQRSNAAASAAESPDPRFWVEEVAHGLNGSVWIFVCLSHTLEKKEREYGDQERDY
jgi:succinate dehydrogenase/fumarate reductase cytochrome b subunit